MGMCRIQALHQFVQRFLKKSRSKY